MHCIETETGNLFVRTKAGQDELFFYLNPKNGKHLTKQHKFHPKTSYEKAKKNWGRPEIPVPTEAVTYVEKILTIYLAEKEKKNHGATISGEPAKTSNVSKTKERQPQTV